MDSKLNEKHLISLYLSFSPTQIYKSIINETAS